MNKIGFLLLVILCETLLLRPAEAANGTFTPCYANSTTSADGRTVSTPPYGYYIYLPQAYFNTPTAKLPILFFWHGSGEGGNGLQNDGALTIGGQSWSMRGLYNVLSWGPPWMLNHGYDNNTGHYGGSYNPEGGTPGDATSPGGIFGANNCIVVAAQYYSFNGTSTWLQPAMRAEINYILSVYGSHIDTRRFYMTGLSYGTQAIADFMNNDSSPQDMTATFMAAYTGVVPNSQATALAPSLALWILDDRGDGVPSAMVDPLAGNIAGVTLPSVLNTEPQGTSTNTANFNGTSWVWVNNTIDGTLTVNPKLTRLTNSVQTGSTHTDSWLQAYNTATTWNWLFAHIKPSVTITAPSTASAIVSKGSPVTLTATASAAPENGGAALSGNKVVWTSNLDGKLGTGTSISPTLTHYGAHLVRCQVADGMFSGQHADVVVTVPYTGAFTAKFNFEPASVATPGGNWNTVVGGYNSNTQIWGYQNAVVSNAIDYTTGTQIGVRLAVTTPFFGSATNGVVSTALFTSPVQTYSFDAYNSHPAQVTISGLNPAQTYRFDIFGSAPTAGGYGTVTYTVGGSPVTMSILGNTSNLATWQTVTPDATGSVVVNIATTSPNGASQASLNALVISTAGAPLSPLQVFHAIDNSNDTAIPGNDGVPNLMKYAFNMTTNNYADLNVFNRQIVTAMGTSGLPLIQVDGTGHLTVTFVERIASTNPGITYTPQVSDDLVSWSTPASLQLTGTTPIDSTWQRVTYTDTAAPTARHYMRVQIAISP